MLGKRKNMVKYDKKKKRKWLNIIIATSLAFIFIATAGAFELAYFLQPKAKTTVNLKAYGKTLSEREYRKAMAETELMYRMNNQTLPTKASALNKIQRNAVKSLISENAMYKQAKKNHVQINEKTAKKNGESFYKQLKQKNQVRYAAILKKYNTTDQAMHRFIVSRNIKASYGEQEKKEYLEGVQKDKTGYSKKPAGTINGEIVTRGEYTYYLIMKNLSSISAGNGSVAVSKTLNRKIFKEIAKNRSMIQYCDRHHIAISDKEVNKTVKKANKALQGFFKDDQELDNYLNDFGLSLDQFKQYQKEQAKADVAQEAIESDVTKDIKVSDKEIKAYYTKHADAYEKDTVSVAQILTRNEKFAEQLTDEAKNIHTKKAFNEFIKKYQSNKHVVDAGDLGQIKPNTMVMAFSNAAFSAPLNQAIGPVKTRYGYHVIFVYKRHVADTSSNAWKSHKESIIEKLRRQKGQAESQALIKSFGSSDLHPLSTLNTPEDMYVNDHTP